MATDDIQGPIKNERRDFMLRQMAADLIKERLLADEGFPEIRLSEKDANFILRALHGN